MPSKPSPPLLPILSLLLGATLWGVIWYPLRLLEDSGLSGLWTSLTMYLAVIAIGLPWLWLKRAELYRRPMLLLGLALTAGWCNIAFVLAVIDGTVVRVLLLFYLSPIWAALLGWGLLGERLSKRSWIGFVLAMSGALIMLWEPGMGVPMPQGSADWLALSSGLSFALSNVLVRKAQDISVPIKTISVWWGGALLAGIWLAASGSDLPDVGLETFAGAVALGWFGIVIMTLAVQYGVTHMPLHRSAVILLFELVAGALSAQWLAGESLQAREWMGGALIILAAYISA